MATKDDAPAWMSQFGVPAGSSPGPAPKPNLREQASLADLAGKYLGQRLTKAQLDRLNATPLPQPPKSAVENAQEAFMLARAREIGTGAAKAEVGLPGSEMTARTALENLNRLMAMPGRTAAVGLPNPFRGGFGPIGTVPGTSARNFVNQLEKAKAGAFLQAIAALRGTGSISEKESAAATAALNNMSTSTSEDEFNQNAQEYATIVQRGLEVQRKQASMRPTPFGYADLLAEKERRAQMKKGK